MTGSSITSRVYSDLLHGRSVFLSASFPSIDRPSEYYKSARPFDISDAALEAARAVFGSRGKLVSGAHPTIVPLILSVGRDFLEEFSDKDRPLVHVYQSKFFGDIPQETRLLASEGIARIFRTEAIDNDREKSLFVMRKEMLRECEETIAGAILIGGMEGVYSRERQTSEFHLFKMMCSGRPIYPIGSTGGAARLLLDDLISGSQRLDWPFQQVNFENLLHPTSYAVLMRKLVLDMARRK